MADELLPSVRTTLYLAVKGSRKRFNGKKDNKNIRRVMKETRKNYIGIRVTKEELQKAKEQAEKEGRTVSNLIRFRLKLY